jgi:hypothetical protein
MLTWHQAYAHTMETPCCLQERDETLRHLDEVKRSTRATRASELEKQTVVLLEEVARLRQVNGVLHERGVAAQNAHDHDIAALRAHAAGLVEERRKCICMRATNGRTTAPTSAGRSRSRGWSAGTPKIVPQPLERARMAHEMLMLLLDGAKRSLTADVPQYGEAGKEERAAAEAVVDFMATHVERCVVGTFTLASANVMLCSHLEPRGCRLLHL